MIDEKESNILNDLIDISFSMMSSQAADPIWTSFPLIKFSHHTGPNGSRSHAWTHINYRNDLKLILRDIRIIDDYGNYETRSWMKVVGGTEVMVNKDHIHDFSKISMLSNSFQESQDLSQLVNLSQEFSSSLGIEHPIEIVVRSPFLAMRYPKTASSERRIQVKFVRDSDFSQVVQLLTQLGLSVLDKDVSKSGPATNSSRVPTRLSSSNTCNINMTLQRPSSTGLIPFPIGESSSRRATFSSPIKSSFSNQMGSDSTLSEDCRPAHKAKFYASNVTRPFSANSTNSNSIQASPFPGMISYHETEHSCPSLFLSQKQIEVSFRCNKKPSGHNRHMSQPIIPNSSLGFSEPARKKKFQFSSSHSQTAETCYQSGNQNDLLTVSQPHRSHDKDGKICGTQLTETEENHDHQSSSLTLREDDQNIWIPPKRKLPFSRPQDENKASSGSVKDLPPLPKPTPVTKAAGRLSSLKTAEQKEAGSKKRSQRTVRKKSTVVKSPIKTILSKESESEINKDGKSLANIAPQKSSDKPDQVKTKSKPNNVTSLRHKPIKRSLEMLNKGTQTLDCTQQNNTPSQRDNVTKSDKIENLVDPQTPEPCSNHIVKAFEKSITCRDQTLHRELCDRTGYAEASDEIRHSLIQDFICESLENEDFLQLCKDVEFSWQRICLGM
ncbi:hypothetical protein GcM3_039012 [Golovinomyces cichoracearum]|uniref:Uncharacterized protein n=1 Tax=Golovinomyces cichoracearum TaxID=62708 RepID=A0A420J2V5_9PEZI|nr:hypothetical protein GcM3_039012 [Golovinomyces cichoracearum]